jgi:hypothetical protein
MGSPQAVLSQRQQQEECLVIAVRGKGGASTVLPIVGAALVLLVALPLAGMLVAGRLTADHFKFPPSTMGVPAEQPGFSPGVFAAFAAIVAVIVGPPAWRVARSFRAVGSRPAVGRFPVWGWAGVAVEAAAWALAWHTPRAHPIVHSLLFAVQWAAYTVIVNALTARRAGSCMLTREPLRLLLLVAVSAVFWWYFEYLNRFVRNWYYEGVGELTPREYLLFATLPFATVIPAVASTVEWLETYPRLAAGLKSWAPAPPGNPRERAAAFLAAACAGLWFLGLRPDALFPLLWVAPLLVLACLQALARRKTVFGGLASGDWRRLWISGLAALFCGFFWEMWNSGCVAHWVYTVPYVNRWKIFEMPLIGYAGYLPFGVECVAIAELLPSRRAR